MKDLIIATLAVALICGSWLAFLHYTEKQSGAFIQEIREEIMPAIESEDWAKSRQALHQFRDDWHSFRKTALYFLNTNVISEIDYALAKVLKYIEAEDISNSTGELNAMAEQLSLITDSEKLTLQNIF